VTKQVGVEARFAEGSKSQPHVIPTSTTGLRRWLPLPRGDPLVLVAANTPAPENEISSGIRANLPGSVRVRVGVRLANRTRPVMPFCLEPSHELRSLLSGEFRSRGRRTGCSGVGLILCCCLILS
jgi:hypothetical protein